MEDTNKLENKAVKPEALENKKDSKRHDKATKKGTPKEESAKMKKISGGF